MQHRRSFSESRSSSRWLVILCLLLPLLWSPSIEAETAGPALWKVQGGQEDLWLFGTFHLLPVETNWRRTKIDRSLAAADRLVLEAPIDGIGPEALLDLMEKYGLYGRNMTLWDVLNTEDADQVRSFAAKIGLPTIVLQSMRPWLAYVSLTQQYAQAQGLRPEEGVDLQLAREGRSAGKEILYFESVEDQLAMFDSQTEAEQIAILRVTLDQLNTMPDAFTRLFDAWIDGDVDTLADLVSEGSEQAPSFWDALFTRRNEAWVEVIDHFLKDDKSYFIAVGAGHLVGDGSVVDLLRAKGYRVTRQ